MKYILEYNIKDKHQTYILEREEYEPYEDSDLKYILLDDSLIKEIPLSLEFNEFMFKSALEGKSMLDKNGQKTEYFDSVITSFSNTTESGEIKKKELLGLLSDSDWKVTVNYELIGTGLPPKYDPVVLHKDRQKWRDEINKIQSKGK